VYAVDDDETVLDVLRLLLKTVRLEVAAYTSPGEFLEKVDPHRPGCVVLDLWMPELNGFETLIRLRERSQTIPVVFLTGYGDLPAAVRAMRLGAVDLFEKPVNSGLLLECIQHWVQHDIKTHEALRRRQATLERLAKLSNRQRQVLDCVLKGMSNKETARHLGVSPKAIEISRALVMQKMGAGSVAELVFGVCGCLHLGGRIDGLPPCLQGLEHGGLVDSIAPRESRTTSSG
jgi:FixJ family two-component response regulator